MRNPVAGGAKTTPCCNKVGIKKGPWTTEEDNILTSYIKLSGEGAWRTLPKRAGLLRCGKSCRLRWKNYLRPHLNHSPISPDEEDLILRLHRLLGNRWSLIAGRIPGRTDNEIKNYWNTHLSKKLISQGLDPRTHTPLEIYNPKHTNHPNDQPYYGTTSSPINQDKECSVEPNPIPATSSMPSPPPPPLPVVLSQQQHNEGEDAKEKEKAIDGMMMMTTTMMGEYNEDMYLSSFLDSFMMGDDCSVFQQHPGDGRVLLSTYDDPNQGLDWGSETHDPSAQLMASRFPLSETDHS